jgi:SAM-dependent methyltransferase
LSRETGPEATHGGLFYDDETVFSRYTAHRRWATNPNLVMEEPALLGMVGDVTGARVIDLGCGDAALGRSLLEAGCLSYTGIDGSRRMLEEARRTLEGTPGRVKLGTIEDFSARPASVDLVLSRLAFHYVEDIEPVFKTCHDCLVPGGRLIFTVVHPVITSHDAAVPGQKRTNWVVDDYFARGARARIWMGGQTVWFHRTTEDYVSALQHAGFRLTGLSECAPTETLRSDDPDEYHRRSRVPLFLLLAGEKPQWRRQIRW